MNEWALVALLVLSPPIAIALVVWSADRSTERKRRARWARENIGVVR